MEQLANKPDINDENIENVLKRWTWNRSPWSDGPLGDARQNKNVRMFTRRNTVGSWRTADRNRYRTEIIRRPVEQPIRIANGIFRSYKNTAMSVWKTSQRDISRVKKIYIIYINYGLWLRRDINGILSRSKRTPRLRWPLKISAADGSCRCRCNICDSSYWVASLTALSQLTTKPPESSIRGRITCVVGLMTWVVYRLQHFLCAAVVLFDDFGWWKTFSSP